MTPKQAAYNLNRDMMAWFQDEAEQEILSVVPRTVRQIQQEVVTRTRIKTGRSKSSWNVSVGTPDYSVDPAILDDDETTWLSRQQALAKAQMTTTTLDNLTMKSGDLFISNGVHYIQTLEALDAMAEGTVHWATTFMPVQLTGPVHWG